MRVGIVTQHFLRNYGGIVQNYALQQVLTKLGHEPITFEHDTCYTRFRWLLRSARQILKDKSFKALPEYPYKGRVGHHRFIDFIIKNINSVAIHHFSAAIHKKYRCGAYITGSDQVWRPAFNLGNRIYNMYLDFVPDSVNKIAYAASLGVSEWEYTDVQTQRCRLLANRFTAVSVREASGIYLCKNYLGVDVVQVLDPTLLLSRCDYEKVCRDVPERNPFIFVYVLEMSDDLQRVVDYIAEKKHLSVKIVYAGNGIKETDSIEEWFAGFRDAEYVVTDSFHGMVFSLIFNKEFNVVMNHGGGTSRYESLLRLVGLENRIVTGTDIFSNDIDWDTVNKKIDELRKPSINFIKEALI